MKCNTTLLIGVGALALSACSDAGRDESSPGIIDDAGTETTSAPVQIEPAAAPSEAAATPAPTAAAMQATPDTGEAPARTANRTRESEPAPQPQPTQQASAPAQEPSPTPSPTCAPEHRELGHC